MPVKPMTQELARVRGADARPRAPSYKLPRKLLILTPAELTARLLNRAPLDLRMPSSSELYIATTTYCDTVNVEQWHLRSLTKA